MRAEARAERPKRRHTCRNGANADGGDAGPGYPTQSRRTACRDGQSDRDREVRQHQAEGAAFARFFVQTPVMLMISPGRFRAVRGILTLRL